jgi:hypothetical protein
MKRVRVAVVLLVVCVSGAWAHSAVPEFSLDPVMTKGAPAAQVTIVEFSDYQ